MKKVLVGMFIALMGVFMVSCSNTGGIEKAKEILSELKASGANLDAEGLKAKMMEFAEALKPEMTKIADMMKEVKKDPSKAEEIMTMEKLEGLKDIEPLMSEFEKLAEEIPAMKELEADEEFGKKFQEALGMPEGL